jgi:hypothetical protein
MLPSIVLYWQGQWSSWKHFLDQIEQFLVPNENESSTKGEEFLFKDKLENTCCTNGDSLKSYEKGEVLLIEKKWKSVYENSLLNQMKLKVSKRGYEYIPAEKPIMNLNRQ